MAEVLVIGKKISEMGLVNEVTGEEKIPTSALGDKAVTTGQLLSYVNNNGVAQWGRIGGDITNQVDLQNQFTQERDTLKSYTQEQVSQQQVALQEHIQDQGNPHNITKEQVGLGLADNTADMDKPVSTAVQEALSLKADQTYVDDSLGNKTHNSLLSRDADGAHPAGAILDGSGITQQQVNDLTGAPYRVKAGGYNIGERVVLENGDIVQSVVSGNTNDPNSNMSGWVNFNSDISAETELINSRLAGEVVSQQAGAMFTENFLEYIPDYKTIILERLIDSYQIYRKCGDDVWEKIQMRTNISGYPLRVGEIWLVKPSAYAIPYTGSSVTLTDGWAAQRSGSSDMFVGGVEAYSSLTGDKATMSITLESRGAIGIVVRKSNNTGMLKVTINGGTQLISLQPKDIDGNVVIDTYSAVQTYKVHIPLANSLPAGTYTVEVEVLGERNPLSIANRINLNGFYFRADGVSDPLTDLAHAPLWKSGEAVVTNEHRYWLGNEYSAVAGGTTGSTPPTHTTGTVSDGAVSWLGIRSSYGGDSQLIRLDTSESEFAGVQENISTGVRGEWGGDIHGGEQLDNLEIVADGTVVNLSVGEVVRCSMVSFKQKTTGLDTTDNNSPMLDIDQRHDFTASGVNYEYTQTALKQLKITSFYPWMHTVYHYDQLSRRFLFDYVHTPRRGRYKIANSYGNSSIQFGLESSKEMMATGTAFKPAGTSGNPTKAGGTHRVIFKLMTSDEAMGFYKKTTAGAYVQLNPSGKNEPDGGVSEPNSGFFTKLYYASVRNTTLDMDVGDELRGGGSWRTSAIQN